MNHAGENPRPNSVIYTPRTPQMRQRQRFNLSTIPVDEENGLGLESKYVLHFIFEKKDLKLITQ